jgi:hypothetical protein
MADNERLWRIWWLWGIPVAWATAALIILVDSLRTQGYPRWGDFFDVLRLLLYWWWLQRAWRCAPNVERRLWTLAARVALSAGLVLSLLV